ncbi:hypothetical protein Bca52824_092230 [Brassica carinata]|uniref:Uncharacterized protein n=1 Tax=Brassica carinata TaxID=52824 RepID=A0A8X7TE95_BRACI|nr:hypothetical protein Bca52824_092230 [Brassica carinata]
MNLQELLLLLRIFFVTSLTHFLRNLLCSRELSSRLHQLRVQPAPAPSLVRFFLFTLLPPFLR